MPRQRFLRLAEPGAVLDADETAGGRGRIREQKEPPAGTQQARERKPGRTRGGNMSGRGRDEPTLLQRSASMAEKTTPNYLADHAKWLTEVSPPLAIESLTLKPSANRRRPASWSWARHKRRRVILFYTAENSFPTV